MKKILLCLMGIILSATMLFAGCNDNPYKNMCLSISEGNEISMYLVDSTDEGEVNLSESEDSSNEDNIITITATVDGAKKKISKKSLFTSSDISKLSVESVKYEGNVSTAKLRAKSPGKVQVVVRTEEGNVVETVNVEIIKEATAMSFDKQYDVAVVANGQEVLLDKGKIQFEPLNANNREIIWSLKEDIDGVTLTSDGKIAITKKTVNKFIVIATPANTQKDDLQCELTVNVLENIIDEDINILANGEIIKNDGVAEIVANSSEFNKMDFQFSLSDKGIAKNLNVDDLVIDLKVLDTEIAFANRLNDDLSKITVQGVERGITKGTISVYSKAYPTVKIYEITINLNIISSISKIKINNSTDFTAPIDIFMKKSIPIVVDFEPITAEDKTFTISSNYMNNLIIKNASGLIFTEFDNFRSGQKLYIQHDGTINAEQISIEVKPNHNYVKDDLLVNLTLNLHRDIDAITCESKYIILDNGYLIENVDWSKSVEEISEKLKNVIPFDYVVEPANAYKGNISVVSEDETIVKVLYSKATQQHYLVGISAGLVRVKILVDGILKKQTSVEVVSSYSMFLVQENVNSNSQAIRKVEKTPVSSGQVVYGSTIEDLVIKAGERIKLEVVPIPEKSKIAKISYKIEQVLDDKGMSIPIDSVIIGDDGYLLTTNAVAGFKINIKVWGYVFNDQLQKMVIQSDEEAQTSSISCKSIWPLESATLNMQSTTVYDINTIGFANKELATKNLSLDFKPSNAAISKENIVWTINDANYAGIIQQNEDGSAVITGKMPNDGPTSQTVIVRATITEYNFVTSQACTITIVKAKQVNSILLNNYDEERGIYLKHSSKIGEEFTPDTYQIDAVAQPYNALNTNLTYIAFDIERREGASADWFAKKEYDIIGESRLIRVNNDGNILTNDGCAKGGFAVVWVIPDDRIKDAELTSEAQIEFKRELLVKVADGSEELPFEINNYSDLNAINVALDKNYVLSKSIDLSALKTFTPIGSINNPFTGKLKGIYLTINGEEIKNYITGVHFDFNNTTSTTYVKEYFSYGLFNKIGFGGVVQDLTIYVNDNNVSLSVKAGARADIGVLAGVNEGQITNVNIIMKRDSKFQFSKVGDGETTINLGGLVGVNNAEGQIDNSKVLTYLDNTIFVEDYKVNNAFNIIDSVSTTSAEVTFGGLVGYNNGSIMGQFVYVGDDIHGDVGLDVTYVTQFNADANNTNMNINAIKQSNTNSVWGGVVGYNNNLINNVESACDIHAYNNIGGICAINQSLASNYDNAKISNARFTGSIIGQSNIGGIVAINNSLVIYAIVETTTDKFIISLINEAVNAENIGGIVGAQNSDGITTFCFINSYVVQQNDSLIACIDFNNQPATNVGGVVGNNAGILENSFSNINMNKSNLTNYDLLAGVQGIVVNCYTLGYYKNEKPSTINQNWYNRDSGSTISVIGLNYDLPMIKIDNEKILFTQTPTSLEIAMNDSVLYDFYKFDVKKGVLTINKDATTNAYIEKQYSFNNLIDVTIKPLTERTKTVFAEIVVGSEIARIEGGTLIVYNEGYIKVKITSDLDRNIHDYVEFYVISNVREIEVTNDLVKNGYNYLELRKETSYKFNISNKNGVYTALSFGGYQFNVSNAGFVSFDNQVVETEQKCFVGNEYNQVINGLGATSELLNSELLLTIAPYANVYFEDDESNLQMFRCVLNDITYELKVKVFEGTTDLRLEKISDTIMPSTDMEMDVTLKTDLRENFIDSIDILDGDGIFMGRFDIDFSIDTFNEENIVISFVDAENVALDKSILKFDISINKSQLSLDDKERVVPVVIKPLRKIGAVEQDYNYSLRFNYTLGDLTKQSKIFSLRLRPQEVENIYVSHYNDGEPFDMTLTGAGEEVSTKIISGQYGLLILNLWPEYSYLEEFTIESSVVADDVISFEQVYYNEDLNNYGERVPNQSKLKDANGIKLISASQLVAGNPVFNGKVYIKTICSSAVPENSEFIITIKAYSLNENGVKVLVKELTHKLLVESPPYLDFALNLDFNGQEKSGETDHYYVANGVLTKFALTIEKTSSALIKITALNSEKVINMPEPVSSNITNTYQSFNYDFINSNINVGETYEFMVEVSKDINGMEAKARKKITITFVDFLIKGFTIENSQGNQVVKNGLLSYALDAIGIDLRVTLNGVWGAGAISKIKNIQDKLNGLTTIDGVDYYNPYKLHDTQTGAYNAIVMEQEYDNFIMSRQEKGYNILGKNLVNVDVIQVAFTYDYINGNVVLVTDDSSIQNILEQDFRLDFSISSSRDNPIPVNSYQDFLSMKENGDYILMKDIELGSSVEDYKPMNTNISSLDGNGYDLILVNGFDVASATTGTSVQLGVFKEISSSTLLKNVKVVINKLGKSLYDLTKYSDITFGYLAAVNNGVLTNVSVQTQQEDNGNNEKLNQEIMTSISSTTLTINSNIGGLVGINNGTITNSQVENISITTQGTLGGFVAINNSKIASSYVKNCLFTNTSGTTGGFVASNKYGGSITTSYSQGDYAKNIVEVRATNSGLIVSGNAGGFVWTNEGSISDCMANMRIESQARSAGFVYDNQGTGIIENALSYSQVKLNDIAHMPFVGTKYDDTFLQAGTMKNVFYYCGPNDIYVRKDILNKESGAQVIDNSRLSKPDSYIGFSFNGANKNVVGGPEMVTQIESSEYEGIWVMPIAENTYFTQANTKEDFRTGVPTLVSANIVAQSRREIDEEKTKEESTTGNPVYYYNYVTDDGFKAKGTVFNPAIISTAEDFNEELSLGTNGLFKQEIGVYARIINDIDFKEYDEKLKTSYVNYSGMLDGNGMTLSNISLVSDIDNFSPKTYSSFGLFAQLKDDGEKRGVIKNINLEFIEVKATQTAIVGGVVGTVHNSVVFNVSASCESTAVKGSNIVGGVFGLVDGDSKIFNIESKMSANAGYRNYDEVNKKMLYTQYSKSGTDTTLLVSYAGSIAGVLDIRNFKELDECMIRPCAYGLSVNGNSRVIGNNVGGAFGLIGIYSHVSNVEISVVSGQYIDGDNFAGGIVAELRGKLSRSFIEHDKLIQNKIDVLGYGMTSTQANETFYKENSNTLATGGLVALNLGGQILDCYSKVNVSNKLSDVAGGIVGVDIGGDIKATYTNSSVIGKRIVGGFIGKIQNVNIPEESDLIYYAYQYLPNDYFDESIEGISTNLDKDSLDANSLIISYIVSANNWKPSDLASNKLLNGQGGLFGGVIGEFSKSLEEGYLITIHPTVYSENVKLVNYFVAGNEAGDDKIENSVPKGISSVGNRVELLSIFNDGGESKYSKVLNIATPVLFKDITASKKHTYFYNWYENVWDYSDDTSKYPFINPRLTTGAIEISTAEQLSQIIWNLSGDYILIADIDLSAYETWLPIGSNSAPFVGTLTSKIKNYSTKEYYGIKNLKIIKSNIPYIGLFGYTSYNPDTFKNASISNISVSVKSIDATKNFIDTQTVVGVLVANARAVDITNCKVVPANSDSALYTSADISGGLVGTIANVVGSDERKEAHTYASKIDHCSVSLPIKIASRGVATTESTEMIIGGLVGSLDDVIIEAGYFMNPGEPGAVVVDSYCSATIGQRESMSGVYDDYNCNVVVGGLIGFAKVTGQLEVLYKNETIYDVGVTRCVSQAKIDIQNLNDDKKLTIGGFVGRTLEEAIITTGLSMGDIIINQTKNLELNKLFVGGFVGEAKTAKAVSIYDCVSLTTIKNESIADNVRGFVGCETYRTPENDFNFSECYYDKYVSMLENLDITDNNSNILKENDIYSKPTDFFNNYNFSGHAKRIDDSFYQFIIDRSGTVVGDGEIRVTLGSKLKPIEINGEDDLLPFFNTSTDVAPEVDITNYNYYIQTENIFLSEENGKDAFIPKFYGFYNGNGYAIKGINITQSKESNVGFIGEMTDSAISGLKVIVNIETSYTGDLIEGKDLPDYNVGGLVGYAKNSQIFACVVEGEIFATTKLSNRTLNDNEISWVANIEDYKQKLNIGGVVGKTDRTNLIYVANYANVASFDYLTFRQEGLSTKEFVIDELSLGGLVGESIGNADNTFMGSTIKACYNYSTLEWTGWGESYTHVGQLIGKGSNTQISKWYSSTVAHKLENKIYNDIENIGYVVNNVAIDSNTLIKNYKDAEVRVSWLNDSWLLNYGLPTFEIYTSNFNDNSTQWISESVYEEDIDGSEDKKSYILVNRAEALQFVLESNPTANIRLIDDIYWNDELASVSEFSGQIDGQLHKIHEVNDFIIDTYKGDSIKNLAVVESTNALINEITDIGGSNIVVENCSLDNDLATTIAGGVNIKDVKTNSMSYQFNPDKWVELGDGVNRVRDFVEYWHESDLRGVRINFQDVMYSINESYIDDETGKLVISEDVTEYVDEKVFAITNVYELSKMLYINSLNMPIYEYYGMKEEDIYLTQMVAGEEEVLRSDVRIYIHNNMEYDLSDKIWRGLGVDGSTFEATMKGAPLFKDFAGDAVDNRATISNVYVEGDGEVGFIGLLANAYNEEEIANLKFKNMKAVSNVKYAEAGLEGVLKNGIGAVIGSAGTNNVIYNIGVSGYLVVDAPYSNGVGGVIGNAINVATLSNIKIDVDAENSYVHGLDSVGGIGGDITIRGKIESLSNNCNVYGRDAIGGYLGYATNVGMTTTLVGDSQNVGNNVKKKDYKNTGNVYGRNCVGGIIGYDFNLGIEDVVNGEIDEVGGIVLGNVFASGNFAGGLFGYTNSRINNVLNSGTVKYVENAELKKGEALLITSSIKALRQDIEIASLEYKLVAGTQGKYSLHIITPNEADGKVIYENIKLQSVPSELTGYFFGGIVSVNTLLVERAINEGEINSQNFVGGIAGLNFAEIRTTDQLSMNEKAIVNKGFIKGKVFVGGIAGFSTLDGEIKEAMNDSPIYGNLFVGGITGFSDGWIYNCEYASVDLGDNNLQPTWLLTAEAMPVNYYGNISGYMTENATIEVVNASNKVYLSGLNSMPNLTVNGVDYSYTYYGGITPINNNIVRKSGFVKSQIVLASDLLDQQVFVGGIVGVNTEVGATEAGAKKAIEECYADISSIIYFEKAVGLEMNDNSRIAGIAGLNKGVIKNCYSLSNIKYISILENSVQPFSDSIAKTYAIARQFNADSKIISSYGLSDYTGERDGIRLFNYNDGSGSNSIDDISYEIYFDSSSNKFALTDFNCNGISNEERLNKFIKEHYTMVVLDSSEQEDAKIEILPFEYEISQQVTLKGILYDFNYVRLVSTDSLYSSSNNVEYSIDRSTGHFDLQDFVDKLEGDTEFVGPLGNKVEQVIVGISELILRERTFASAGNLDYENRYEEMIHDLDTVIFPLAYTKQATPLPSFLGTKEEQTANPVSTRQLSVVPELSNGLFMGTGTYEEPYLLGSAASFMTIQNYIDKGYNFAGKYFQITKDIDFGSVDFKPIVPFVDKDGTLVVFSGTIDGKGHKLKNLTYHDESADNIGLFTIFGNQSMGDIYDVVIENFNMKGRNNVGTIAGINYGSIGMASTSSAIVIRASNDEGVGEVVGENNVGGVVGLNYGTLNTISVTMPVTGKTRVGGLAGENQGSINNCETFKFDTNDVEYNYSVTATDEGAGGIAGYSEIGYLTGCANNVTVNGAVYSGGIVGSSKGGSIRDCGNYGQINGSNNIGGIVAMSDNSTEKVVTLLGNCLSVGALQKYANKVNAICAVGSVDTMEDTSLIKLDSLEENTSTVGGVIERTSAELMNNAYKNHYLNNDKNVGYYTDFDFDKNQIWGMQITYITNSGDIKLDNSKMPYAYPARTPSTSDMLTLVDALFNVSYEEKSTNLIETPIQLKTFRDAFPYHNASGEAYTSNDDGYAAMGYLVKTPMFSKINTYAHANYKLFTSTRDQSYSGDTTSFNVGNWDIIESFAGSFDGNGKEVTVKLSKILKGSNEGYTYNGFINSLTNTGKLINIDLSITGATSAIVMGGLACSNYGSIKNCQINWNENIVCTKPNSDHEGTVGGVVAISNVGSNLSNSNSNLEPTHFINYSNVDKISALNV